MENSPIVSNTPSDKSKLHQMIKVKEEESKQKRN